MEDWLWTGQILSWFKESSKRNYYTNNNAQWGRCKMKVFDSLADRWRFHRHFRGHHASLHHTGSRVLLVPLLPDCADGRRRRLYHRRKTNHGRQHLTSILFLKLKIINWRKRERERKKRKEKRNDVSCDSCFVF